MQQQQPHAWPVNPGAFNSMPPVSIALYGTTSSWAHTVPNLMPWCTPASRNPQLKRKGDLADASPSKVCVTEERMAARFREMHISKPHPTNCEEQHSAFNDCSRLTRRSEKDTLSSAKSLILAPEIKKLVEPEKIFASTFFNKVERPSMALVVWQPQQQVFGATRQEGSSSTTLSNESEEPKPPDEEMAD